MRWNIISVVYRRELRDVLRDRRTLFTMLVLPVILYPALLVGFSKLTMSRAEELMKKSMPVLLRMGGVALDRNTAAPTGSLEAELIAIKEFQFEADRSDDDARAQLKSGELALFVDLPADLSGRVERGEEVRVVPGFRSSDELSSAARRHFVAAIERYRDRAWPLVIDERGGDAATNEERGGRSFGGFLAMMVVLMAMTGAFYPALDVAAGEKERGTLETLLLSPASRGELVLGKFLTVLTVAAVAALMNLASLAFTFSGFTSSLSEKVGGIGFSIPFRSGVVIVVGLILIAAFFSALCLALSTFARTYKEGQAYLTPALVLVMPLAMTATLPNLELDLGMALIPVTNLSLLMKGVLMGRFPIAETAVTLGSLVLVAAAALSWTAGLFKREEVLFREGRQVFGLKPPPGVPRPLRPGAGAAILGFLLALVFIYHASARLAAADARVSIVVVQGGLLVMAIALARLSLAPLTTGLGFMPASARFYVAALLCGVAGTALSAGLGTFQQSVLGDPNEFAAELAKHLEVVFQMPLILRILLLGVLPAIAEEVFFRGLVFQGLRGSLKDRGALVVSSVAFGLFHLSVHRILPQASFGMVLGLLMLRSGSIGPSILAHATHNAVIVALSDSAEAEFVIPAWWALIGVAGVLFGLWFARPRARDS